jgi:hypothetical protein
VAVVNVFRLPGIRTHWAAACAGAINLAELSDGEVLPPSLASAVGQSGSDNNSSSQVAQAPASAARANIRIADSLFSLAASAASSSSTVVFGRRVRWWVRPAATTACVVCGVYAARWLLRAVLPRVVSGTPVTRGQ